ncbi:ketopantoate reductase PanE/ApbA C terminal-domain-containing protein [Coniella lustricola]|uniref:Ketopantoate reductase PanE/ApbA C terminal-domain-containing protein n=1 Tax=Coniella lustricola TaxID=2025994 RepID=A0A2T3A6Q2_9PEZI|nr:ketopantoate reductase PanE/ApbA C terminal-domain-containing protein [Coniella lustricola]
MGEEPWHDSVTTPERPRTPLGKPFTTAIPRIPKNVEAATVPRPVPQAEEGKRVHLLGYDPKGYFIAHCLASSEYLDPVKLLVHRRAIMNSWEWEGKRLLKCEGNRIIPSMRAEAEWVGRGQVGPNTEHIEQLIVTLPCCQTLPAITNISHRIDNRTTICLVQDGLGMMEELNATLFQDSTRRPTYILGHSTASIGYYKKAFFSTMLRKPGKLFLTALERGTSSIIKYHPPVERRSNAVTFMRTLISTDGLRAGGYSLENYLMRKLPALVFSSIVEPLAVALDSTYDQVLRNEHAIVLADELLEEIFNVIWALPELTNSSKVIEYCGMDTLRKHTVTRLIEKGPSQSQTLSAVRAGRMVDIDYTNGYFVRRGRELGIKTPQNEFVIGAVKARVEERRKQLAGFVPFEDLAATKTSPTSDEEA